MLTNPLRDRFGVICKLDYYTVDELAKIVVIILKFTPISLAIILAKVVFPNPGGPYKRT